MIKGEKFTFGKVNNNPVLVDSTNNATSGTTEFHGQVKIDKRPTFSPNFTEASGVDNDFTGVPLQISRADSGGEMMNFLQRGSGDNYIRFQTSNVTTDGNNTGNGNWVIGADHVGGTINSFKIYNNTGFSNSTDYYQFKIDDSGNCFTKDDLTVGGDLAVTGGLTVSGGGASTIDMADGQIIKLREVQMQDWDDDTNTNDTTRLFRRDGCWMYYNGAVAIGSFGNNYDGGGVGPSNAGSGDLVIKDQILFPKKSLSGNQSCISIGIDGEKVAYGFHFFDDDDTGTTDANGNSVVDQRAYIGYSASSNKLILQQHRLDSSTNESAWPSFQLDQQGDGTMSGTLSQNSDSRLKDNVVTITNSLDTIKQLRGVSFDWNNLSSKPGRKDFGLIAQEVEAVIPELVSTSTDTFENAGLIDNPDGSQSKAAPGVDNIKSLSYATLAGHFVEAIKEQQTIIEDLKARIETLENA
jgi:hypothetical protein